MCNEKIGLIIFSSQKKKERKKEESKNIDPWFLTLHIINALLFHLSSNTIYNCTLSFYQVNKKPVSF